jgi:hypothetical protein
MVDCLAGHPMVLKCFWKEQIFGLHLRYEIQGGKKHFSKEDKLPLVGC